MIIKDVELETVCGITSKLPENIHPKFTFTGKSSVGESSLINALMNRKSYARTSSQPGGAQIINFHHINDALYYVDPPDHGYAKVTLAAKERWGKMMENYLQKSLMLKMAFLLTNICYESSTNDRAICDRIIHNGYRPVIVATKLDKTNRNQIQGHAKMLRTGLGMEKEGVSIPFSTETKQGREGIWGLVEGQMADWESGGCNIV